MAVYSYTSSATLNIKNGYDGDLLGSYPGYFVSTYNEEKISFGYNQSSVVDYDVWDYGSISNPVTEDEDYGEITASIELWYQIQDYGTLEINTTRVPYGSLNLTDFADASLVRVSVGGVVFALFGRAATEVIFNPVNRVFDFEGTAEVTFTQASAGNGIVNFTRIKSTDSVGFNPPESVFLLKIQGSAVTYPVFYEGDRVFDIEGTADESITYDYNDSSKLDLNSDDYGFITEAISRDEDFGLISEGQDIQRWDSRAEDWGLITEDVTVNLYGKFRLFGKGEERFIFANYEGSWGNKQPRLLGTAKDYATPKINGSGKITLEGTPRIQIRMHYKADGGWDRFPDRFRGGSLFGFSSATQTSTFSQISTGKLFSIQSATTYSAVRDEVGISNEDILIRGNANYIVIFNEVDRVLTFSNIEENRRVYSYNESSIVNVEGIDYGLVNESPTLFEDYQDITGESYYPWQIDDYGFLIPDNPLFPYGSFNLISTTADSQTKIYVASGSINIDGNGKIFVLPKHNGSGTARFEGVAVEKNTENYVGNGSLFGFSSTAESRLVSEESKGLFKFSGSVVEKNTENYVGNGSLFGFDSSAESYGPNPTEQGELFKFVGNVIEKNTENYVGSGSLFGIVGAAERVTYSYNESSIVDIQSDDYGFVSELESLFQDNGNIIDVAYYPWEENDYGYIIPDTPRRPYGKFEFVSTTEESFTKGNYTGSGSIEIDGNGKIFVLPKHNGSGIIRFVGELVEKNTENYVGSGSLFGFDSATESISNVETSKELFRFVGSAVEKNTENYVGSGSLFGFDSSAESYGPNPDEQGELFKFSGTVLEKNITNYVGSGSLFGFTGAAERVTYSYNESAVVDIESDDYGFINEAPSFNYNYGLVGDQATYSWQGEDYGYIIPDTPRRPYGKFEFVSEFTESQTNSYVGSGSLFGFSSTTESTKVDASGTGLFRITGRGFESITPQTEVGSGSIFTFVSSTETAVYNPPESTELFKINGEAYVVSRNSYDGNGTLTLSGEARIFVLPKHTGRGTIRIAGRGFESTTPATHVGSGSIFTFVSFTETAVYNPPEETELFRIIGSAVERNTEAYNATGILNIDGSATTIFRLRVTETGREPIRITGSGLESVTPATHIGSGTLFGFSSTTESISNAETSKELFRFVGSAVEKNTEVYLGTGRLQLSNKATTIFRLRVTETGREPIKLVGDAVEKNTENYVGSGSLFGFSSTTESISNAETSKELFRFSGAATESITPAPHVGSGSIFTFVSFTETTTKSEVFTGLFRFSGSAVEKNTENYVGSGALFGFISGTESRSVSETSQELFRFSGAATESTTPAPHVGSGSIFTFVSFTESRSVSETSQELFRITGSAVEKNTENYVGSGALFGFVSGTESTGSNPPDSTLLLKITGSAVEKNTENYVGSGSIFTFVSFTESRSVSETSQELFRITGSAVEKNTEAYNGTGTIRTIGSKGFTVFRIRVISDGSLVRFSGKSKESLGYGLYTGNVETRIDVNGSDRTIAYESRKAPRIYII